MLCKKRGKPYQVLVRRRIQHGPPQRIAQLDAHRAAGSARTRGALFEPQDVEGLLDLAKLQQQPHGLAEDPLLDPHLLPAHVLEHLQRLLEQPLAQQARHHKIMPAVRQRKPPLPHILENLRAQQIIRMHRQRLEHILAAPHIKLNARLSLLDPPKPHLLKHLAHLARRAVDAARKAVQHGRIHGRVRRAPAVLDQHAARLHHLVEPTLRTAHSQVLVQQVRRHVHERGRLAATARAPGERGGRGRRRDVWGEEGRGGCAGGRAVGARLALWAGALGEVGA